IQSDIVVDVHWVLLFEVSEPVRKNRSRHCTLQENPSSSQALYIQTGHRLLWPAPPGRVRQPDRRQKPIVCPTRNEPAGSHLCRGGAKPGHHSFVRRPTRLRQNRREANHKWLFGLTGAREVCLAAG